MSWKALGSAAALVAFGVVVPKWVRAQDTRTVTEPRVPKACVTLNAALAVVGDSTIAEEDERKLDTQRIQKAIDHCGAGKAVVLAPSGGNRAFLSGPIELRAGVALVVGRGAILFASRDPREYDITAGVCGTVDRSGKGCRPFITANRANGAALMGPGTVDGRGWATLLGKDFTWWQLAEEARADTKLHQNNPRLVHFTRSNDITLYDITLRNSAMFHVMFERGNGFTAWGVVIDTPEHARNTDGIDPSSATNVTITRSWISTGDDNVAIKAGSGGPISNITVSHSHFYSGHGMSVGSETSGGVRKVRVFDLTIDGADNGLRIKSNSARGGVVEDVEYRDVCIRGVKNPVYMDTHYTASAQTEGTLVPAFRDVALRNVGVSGGKVVTLDGHDSTARLGITFDNVVFDSVAKVKVQASHADVRIGPGAMNLDITGEDVRVIHVPATGGAVQPAPSCAGRFAPMPPSVEAAASSVRIAQEQVTFSPAAIVDGRQPTGARRAFGPPIFRTIGDALAGLPPNGGARTVIFVRKGRYHEKLTVDRPRVTLRGEDPDSTILTFDAAAETPAPGGSTYGTRGSYTLRVVAPDFRAESLTIENAWDYRANAAKPDSDKSKFLHGTQGVALMLDLGSDRASFENVRILGNQDTLFPNSGRSYFHRCVVSGNVDFIFGAGRAVFEDCDIISRDRGSATNNGYITAASTDSSQNFGFLFLHSRLKKESPAMAKGSVTLGRPWHPFADPRAIASVAFVDCWMDDHIGAKGWDRMSSIDSTGTRVWYEPEGARFVEYGSTGPGAIASPTRRTLDGAESARYTITAALGDWSPPR
ncbi:MAG: pectinesterase family protein [Gemmatimonadaceae bacterium]